MVKLKLELYFQRKAKGVFERPVIKYGKPLELGLSGSSTRHCRFSFYSPPGQNNQNPSNGDEVKGLHSFLSHFKSKTYSYKKETQVSVAICINYVYLTNEKCSSVTRVSEILNGTANLPLATMDAGTGSRFRPFLRSLVHFLPPSFL